MNCVSNGPGNGLSPVRCQGISWINADLLSSLPLGTNFSENLITILAFSFKKMWLKTSTAKWWSFCLEGNELMTFVRTIYSDTIPLRQTTVPIPLRQTTVQNTTFLNFILPKDPSYPRRHDCRWYQPSGDTRQTVQGPRTKGPGTKESRAGSTDTVHYIARNVNLIFMTLKQDRNNRKRRSYSIMTEKYLCLIEISSMSLNKIILDDLYVN